MVDYEWNEEKNAWLKSHRNASFEKVVELIEADDILEIIKHPNRTKYPRQKVFLLRINNYVNMVPFIKKGNIVFLKTIIPSRKYQRKYREKL